jgi:hypothetical protein
MREFIKSVLVVSMSTIVALGLSEVGLRLAGLKYNGSTYTNDPVLGWALRPGAKAWETEEGYAWSKINSHGFRDRERTLAKPSGEFRIAVLGDSLTEARQVAMNRVDRAVAENELNQNHCLGDRPVEVLNFGVPGYGTGQELLQLRSRVWTFAPDLVVLEFYAGNDIFNNNRKLNIISPDLAPYFLLRGSTLVLDDSFRRLYRPTYTKTSAAMACKGQP